MGHGDTSCDPHLHQTVEQRSTTSRVASAAGRLGSSPSVYRWGGA